MSRYILRPIDRRRFLEDSLVAAGGAWAAGSAATSTLFPSSVLANQAPSLTASISVDATQILHTINPNIYGTFIEHVGRCVNGGVYQENSPSSDEQGFRKDVMKAASDWGVPILRWPGGIFASFYHWEDGVGPKATRTPRYNEAWLEEENNHFGTDEFIDYCRKIGTEPYICINLHNGTAKEAANWVEYCNGTKNTSYANLRRKYGHPMPHNVRYWGLGNEPWAMPAEDYAKAALESGKLMKEVDPNIRLVACGMFGRSVSDLKKMGFDPEWNRVVLEKVINIADYISIHEYEGNDDHYEELGSIQRIEASIKSLAAAIELTDSMRGKDPMLAESLPGIKTKKPIEISCDEWNIWYRKHDLRRPDVPNPVEEKYNLRDALWAASVLNVFQRMGDKLTMANIATMVNAIGTIFTSDQGMFPQTIYFPMKLYRRECGSQALACKVESPTFSSKSFQDVPYLDVSPTLDTARKVLSVAVVNRHATEPIRTTLVIQNARLGTQATSFEINGASPETENSFSKPDNVKINQRQIGEIGEKASYTFPAHSVTVLKLSVA
jgi:alpha-N-arabinofuranosidase